MKIYAMPEATKAEEVDAVAEWGKTIGYSGDGVLSLRMLASQIVARDARIAELEASLDFRTHAREEAGERITELEDERDAAIARLPDGMKHCTIVCEKCEIGHSWLTATNWVEHGCPTCEKNALITRILNLEKAARQIKCVDISQADAVRERDKALRRVLECEATIRERNGEIRDLRILEPFVRHADNSAIRERDAALARADRYGRALKAAVELIP